MDDEEVIRRAHAAQAEYRQTEWAFDEVRTKLTASLIATTPTNTDQILRLHAAVQLVDAVKQVIIETIKAGEYAQAIAEQARLLAD